MKHRGVPEAVEYIERTVALALSDAAEVQIDMTREVIDITPPDGQWQEIKKGPTEVITIRIVHEDAS